MPEIKKLKGKAWVFGDICDVDWEIFPFEKGRTLTSRTNEAYGQYCMTEVDPDFPKKVQKGDFIVAGVNFGYGHDHDSACRAILGCGVAAVICDSTNRNFFRNSINLGLPVIEYKGIRDKVKQGDELEIDLRAGTIRNLTTKETLKFNAFLDFIIEILEAGGVYPLMTKKLKEGDMPLYVKMIKR
jgi:3-isopropylmalate/(R)-2-methylmalate dehydratase small subunit